LKIIVIYLILNVIADSTLNGQKSTEFVKVASTGKDDNMIISYGLNNSYKSWYS